MLHQTTPVFDRLLTQIADLPVIDCHEHAFAELFGPDGYARLPSPAEPIAALTNGYILGDFYNAGADHATCEWTMCLYADDGVAPLLSEPPILIGAVTDECVRGADGRWLYAARTTRPLFKGSKPTSG